MASGAVHRGVRTRARGLGVLSLLALLGLAAGLVRAQVDLVCTAPTTYTLVLQQTVEFVLEQPPSCYDTREVYYVGNYSVQSNDTESIRFTVRYGDQQCDTPVPSNDRYDFASREYVDDLPWTHQWGYYGFYDSYFPKVQIFCGQLDGCNINATVCQNVYRIASAPEGAKNKP